MAEGAYSYSLRVLACAGCGAPVDVSLAGGRCTCSYCGAENLLSARERPERSRTPDSLSEMERHRRLRGQASSESLPAELAPLVADGRLRADRLTEAKAAWIDARREFDSAPSFPLSERLFHLTLLLAALPQARGRRAFLETAIETLPDEGHRHVLQCALVRLAVEAGELSAAGEWLADCDPRPLDLAMDTAYRRAAATLAVAQGRCDEALALLAPGVPVDAGQAVDCELLRIHALDVTGRSQAALDAYLRLRERKGGRSIAVPAGLVSGVEAAARRQEQERWVAKTEAELGMSLALRIRVLLLGAIFFAVGVATLAAVGVVFGSVVVLVLRPDLTEEGLLRVWSWSAAAGAVAMVVFTSIGIGWWVRYRAGLRVRLAQVQQELARTQTGSRL